MPFIPFFLAFVIELTFPMLFYYQNKLKNYSKNVDENMKEKLCHAVTSLWSKMKSYPCCETTLWHLIELIYFRRCEMYLLWNDIPKFFCFLSFFMFFTYKMCVIMWEIVSCSFLLFCIFPISYVKYLFDRRT